MAAVQGWSRWYDDAPTHPKFLAVGHKGGWLYVCGQAYASTHATDGLIPKAIVPRLTDIPSPMKVAARLVEVGLWHDRGDHFEQHDYTEMQTTAEEREAKRQKKSGAGSKGNHQKWHVDRGVVGTDCRWCDEDTARKRGHEPIAGATVNGSHRGSPEAEAEAEEPPSASGAREGLPPAVVEACGMDYPAPDTTAHRQLLAASADLARQGAMPHEVPARARAYRARWPDATLTPHALAKHWPQLVVQRESRHDPGRNDSAAAMAAAGLEMP